VQVLHSTEEVYAFMAVCNASLDLEAGTADEAEQQQVGVSPAA
jgi:hypothetical protein